VEKGNIKLGRRKDSTKIKADHSRLIEQSYELWGEYVLTKYSRECKVEVGMEYGCQNALKVIQ